MAVNKFVFLLFLLLPLQFSLGSVGGSDIASIRLIIPLIVLLWVMHGLVKRNLAFPKPLTLFFFTSFLAWTALSTLWAENPSWALQKLVFWCTFFPLFFVLVSICQKNDVREKVLQGLVWGGALVALVGILQFCLQFILPLPVLSHLLLQSLAFFLGSNFANAVAQYPSIFVNIGGVTFLRAFAFFPDPHIFAYYTAMLIPLAFFRAFQSNSSYGEKSIPGILFLATILSFSRASYVALLVAFGVFIGRALWKYRQRFSVPMILLLIGILTLISVSPVASRFMSSFSVSDGSVSERSRLWHEAIENSMRTPITGVGLGNYPLLVKPSAEPREPIYVHNLYLDLAVEIGLVGLSLFLFCIISCLPKLSVGNDEPLSYRFSLLLSLIIFLTHSFFEYPLFSVHILTLFLTLLALLYVEKIRV